MKSDAMTVHEVANITGITIRALHYYDEIGLLKPAVVTEAKYRLYTDSGLDKLQQILFFKEVGFSLKEIKNLMDSPVYNKQEALQRHLQILNLKKKRIDSLIILVNDVLTGKADYSFSAFSNTKILEKQENFRKEILGRWSNTNEYQDFSYFFQSTPPKRESINGMT